MGSYDRGDIVIVREPADSPVRPGRRDFLVKRVIGVPGDTLEGRSGQVFVNGERLEQSFITEEGVSLGNSTFAPLTLAENAFFIMGDNRTRSADSRLYGPIPLMSIAGRATAVIWPSVRVRTRQPAATASSGGVCGAHAQALKALAG